MELYGIGRFLVTQKADLDNPEDVYRGENGRPEDWVMLGNHDTPSLWHLSEKWIREGSARRQAEYLAGRLKIEAAKREEWIQRVAADEGELAQAKFADLFIGPARNIMVFFTDLLGIKESYNTPGTVSRKNWSLRVHPDYRQRYGESLVRSKALNIPKALATALRARQTSLETDCSDLLRELESPRLILWLPF